MSTVLRIPSPVASAFLAGCLALVAQIALLALVPWREPVPATANAVSAAAAWLNGEGITVSLEEFAQIRSLGPYENGLAVYAPGREREAAQEPLPAMILLYAGLGYVTGRLRLIDIVCLQFLAFALSAAFFTHALARHRREVGLIAGLAWALFVPQLYLNLAPGYDAWLAVVFVSVAAALLRYDRSETAAWLAAAAVLTGIGIWFRSYMPFLAVPVALALWLRRGSVRPAAAYVALVTVFFVGLVGFRSQIQASESAATRGGVWGIFWAGVGQFDNDMGVESRDESLAALASRLDPLNDYSAYQAQFSRRYNEVMGRAARHYIGEHWPGLLRNAAVRVVWLWAPGLMPSERFVRTNRIRLVAVASTLLIGILAIGGAFMAFRTNRGAVLFLLAPWLSLLPLCGLYLIAHVGISVYFAQLSLATWAVVAASDAFRARRTAPGQRNMPEGAHNVTPKNSPDV